MTKQEFFERCHDKMAKMESQEDYEGCAELRNLIRAIKNEDIKSYIKICFDIKTMKKVGFFKPKMTYEEMAERVRVFFGFDSVFEYSFMDPINVHLSHIDRNDQPFIEEI